MKNIKINLFILLVACSGITFASSTESKKSDCALLFEIFEKAKKQVQMPINKGATGTVPGKHVHPSYCFFNTCKKEWSEKSQNNDYNVYVRSITSIDMNRIDGDALVEVSIGAYQDYSAFRKRNNDTP